jgi:hypothetical protein
MRIIGFDPGVKNLGVCVVDVTDLDGETHAVTFIGTLNVTDFIEGIRDMDPYLETADLVAIESQPGTNRNVTKVMYFVELYARLKSNARVVFVAPRTRLAFVRRHTSLETSTYTERKAASIEVARSLMRDTVEFDRLKKRDDPAEAFLCAYIAHQQNLAE